MPDRAGREVGPALVEHHSGVVLRIIADPEVEAPPHHDAELLVLDVVVQDRSGGTTLDPPEAELHRVASDDSPAKAGPIGLAERVVLEEVAVLVGPSRRHRLHQLVNHALLDVDEVTLGRVHRRGEISGQHRLCDGLVIEHRLPDDGVDPFAIRLVVEQ